MMSSNLPPGVSAGSIPGNRAEDQVFERWLDSKIGDLLYELAKDSLPDVAGYQCKRCRKEVDPYDTEAAPGSSWCAVSETKKHEIEIVNWPPFDVEAEVILVLEKVKREVR